MTQEVRITTIAVNGRPLGIRTVRVAVTNPEALLLALVNTYRTEQGLAPLRPSPVLARAARGHSEDMARRRFFSHRSPEGNRPADRVAAAGYGPYRLVGENIAAGTPDAQQTLRAWIGSPAHQALLVNGEVTQAGVGVADREGYRYWTLDFARPA